MDSKRTGGRLLLLFLFFSLIPAGLGAQDFLSAQITSGRGRWRTLRTPHFRIHFPERQRDFAVRMAGIAESVHEELEPKFRSGASSTDVVLVFDNDLVNAYATVWGRDQVVLFLNNPPIGPLHTTGWSRYDLWARELFLHEYVHILSLRQMTQPSQWIFRILTGLPPNILTPRGFVEGIAVHEESLGGKGRNNDPVTHMIIRTAVEQNTLPDASETQVGSHRWPYGSLYYLYGGALVSFISKNYGERPVYGFWKTTALPMDLKARLNSVGIPYYPFLYHAFLQDLHRIYEPRIQEIRGKGVTPYEQLTKEGGVRSHLVLDNLDRPTYFHVPTHRIPGIYRYEGAKKKARRLRRAYESGGIAVSEGRSVMSEDYHDYPSFGIRYELYDGERTLFLKRLLPRIRATAPSLSSDGSLLVYIEKGEYEKSLRYLRFDEKGKPGSPATLVSVPSAGILQYTALSPDARHVVTLLRRGEEGPPSLVLCPVPSGEGEAAGECKTLLSTEEALIHPRYSPDGSRLYFSADGGGIFNLYSLDPESGDLQRHTRTTTGLFYPAPGKDYLYALNYGPSGYDLVRFRYGDLLHDPALLTFREEDEPVGPGSSSPSGNSRWKEKRYGGPFATTFFMTGILNGGYMPGNSILDLGVIARDPLDRHYLTVVAGSGESRPEGYAQYDYTRYSLGFSLYYFSNYWRGSRPEECLLKNSGLLGLLFCDEPEPYFETGSAFFRYVRQDRFVTYQILPGYVHKKLRNADQMDTVKYEARDLNLSGPALILAMGSTHYYPESVSPEDGWRLYLSGEYYTHGESFMSLGATHRREVQYGVAEGGVAFYLPSFFRHHVNYLSLYGYGSLGPDRLIQNVNLALFVRGLNFDLAPELPSAAVFTYEYRFPLLWVSRQIQSSFPEIMLRQLSLTLFGDYGASYDKKPDSDNRAGGYGFTFQAGLNLWSLPVPVQAFVSVAKGTGRAGEVQYIVGMTVGGTGASAGHSSGSTGRDEDLTRPLRRGLPGYGNTPGYFRNPLAGGILR